jgi:23S rRNA (adenine2503-C2)-methyltransferase
MGGGPMAESARLSPPPEPFDRRCTNNRQVMDIADLRQQLRARGARPDHVERVIRRWIQGLAQDSRHRHIGDFLSKAVRQDLPALLDGWNGLACLLEQHPGEDGAVRLLVGLHDGQTVESVLLPGGGLCVSTQVGCAVGCVFCMTGQAGLQRQLGSAEIVAQVVLARTLRAVRKVVFMGMGEPAHNLESVLDAIHLLGTEGQIGHKNLVFSTVGDPRVFDRLSSGVVKPALALSLHSTLAERRVQLLPRAPRIAPDQLVELGEAYARRSNYPIQYQWTLIDGLNDDEAELEGIVRLLCGKYAVLNMIPYNTVAGLDFRRPASDKTSAIASFLNRRGVLTKLRQSAGQDVDAGCGQLRARSAIAGIPVLVR